MSIPEIKRDLSFNPDYLSSGENIYTIITSMYVHADFIHLIFNMLFLVFIGLLLEDKIGTLRYAIIYYIGGIIAAITFSFTTGLLIQNVVILGASGGLFGILGAYARLYPRDKFAFFPFPHPLPIYTWALIFLLLSIFATALQLSNSQDTCFLGRIAHLAHVGGLFAGLAIAPLVMKIPGKETKKMRKIDYIALEKIALSDEDKALLERIKSEDEPEVRDAWLEYLLDKAKCPQCGNKMDVKGRNLSCSCGFELRY
jgi:membrane associated rhomboid family serine protease